MKIKGTMPVEIEIDNKELAHAIMQDVNRRCGYPDDAGCEWTTDKFGWTCIAGDSNWVVSTDPNVASLVDAANILLTGSPVKADMNERVCTRCHTAFSNHQGVLHYGKVYCRDECYFMATEETAKQRDWGGSDQW